jgi:hypothetical protein
MPLILVVIVVIILAFLLLRANSTSVTAEPKQSSDRELLRLCRGNRELAERLLRHELEEKPNINRNKALRLAIERIKRDQ